MVLKPEDFAETVHKAYQDNGGGFGLFQFLDGHRFGGQVRFEQDHERLGPGLLVGTRGSATGYLEFEIEKNGTNIEFNYYGPLNAVAFSTNLEIWKFS